MNTSTADRIISAKERRSLIPYSDMHIWRLEKAGQFPPRIQLGPNRVGWSLEEVVQWMEARKAMRGRAANHQSTGTAERVNAS